VASAADTDSRDVAALEVPGDVGAGTPFSTHPKLVSFFGSGSLLKIALTYDNGIWGDSEPPWQPSNFLVELQGSQAGLFVVDNTASSPFAIYHYVSSDDGQAIYLYSSDEELFSGLTSIRIWRADVFPGDLPPGPFWTSFIGSHEII
jgi:hypothetical protein